MNKELTVTLLKKDIAELAQLTEGFEELDFFPNALLDLAQSKAEKIVENLVALRLEKEDTKETEETNEEKRATIEETESKIETEDTPVAAIQPEKTIADEKEDVEESAEAISENPATELTVEEETVDVQVIEEDQPTESAASAIADKSVEANKILADTIAPQTVTRNESLQNQKVDDIKQAISLGDRFLFQRELFGSNGELMSKTISSLNNCKTLEEAQQLISKKFNWDKENPAAAHFMQIISRRF